MFNMKQKRVYFIDRAFKGVYDFKGDTWIDTDLSVDNKQMNLIELLDFIKECNEKHKDSNVYLESQDCEEYEDLRIMVEIDKNYNKNIGGPEEYLIYFIHGKRVES